MIWNYNWIYFVENNFVFDSQTSALSGWMEILLGISAFSTHQPAMTSSAFEFMLHAFIEASPIRAGEGHEVSRFNSRPRDLRNPSDSNLSASSFGIDGRILGGILATQLRKVWTQKTSKPAWAKMIQNTLL